MRIAYQEETSTFGVLTKRTDIMDRNGVRPVRPSVTTQAMSTSNASTLTRIKKSGDGLNTNVGDEIDVYSLIIVNQNTFEVVHAHTFLQNEAALSIESCKLGDDPAVYYIVGTAMIHPEETEPRCGRLIVFSWSEGRLTQIAEKETKGGVFQIVAFNNKFVSTINSTTRLWEWTSDKDLRNETSSFNHVMALYAKVSGDFILVGDLVRSVSLLQYKQMEGALEEIARSYAPNWMTAVEIIDDERFLGAENTNLFICQRDPGANTDEERQQMTEVGHVHLGDFTNVIRHGSLVMQNLGDSTVSHSNTVLLGTVFGSIKLVTQLSQDLFDLLEDLQTKLARKIKSVGRISHSFYRTTEKKDAALQGFIDGDLIESFLDLDKSMQEDVCAEMVKVDEGGARNPLTLEELTKIVEDLSRIH